MASTVKHLRSSTANKRPTASGLADGQLGINTASGTPGVFFKDSAGTVTKVGPAHVGSTAPNVSPAGSAGNSRGELWVNNSTTINGLNYYTGAAFVNLTPSGTTTVAGLVELATNAETQTGTDTIRAVTPSGLQSKISNSTSTTSSTTIASSTAVKAAYDLADAALPKSGGRVTGALEIGPVGSLVFEGSSDDSFETTLAVVSPTADRTITFPNVTGTVVTTGDSNTVTGTMIAATTITNAEISASAAIALSKLATGALPTDITIASGNIVDGTIANADINASAEIAVSKLADGAARQLLQTDAAGTGVEWTNNVDIPGTLDVTGATVLDGDLTIPDKIIHAGDTNTAIRFPAADTIAFETDGSERVRLDSSGRLLAGTSSGITTVNDLGNALTAQYQLAGNTVNSSGFGLFAYSATAVNQSELIFSRSKSGNIGTHAVVGANDDLGVVSFAGSDGTAFASAASILSEVDGTVASGSVPGRLVLSTTATAGTTPTERLRVSSNGALLVGTTSTPTNAGSGAVVAEDRVVIGAAGGGRHQTIVGALSSVTATTGTVVFKFKSASITTGRACYVKLAISQRNNNNTTSNSPAAEYAFQLHQTTAGVCTLNSATTIFEQTYVRATHFAFADLGSGECTVTLTNPTAFASTGSYKVEILVDIGTWTLDSVTTA